MGMGGLPACMFVYLVHTRYLWRPEEGVSLPELVLDMVVNHHMYPVNPIQVLCKSSQCLQLLSHLSSELLMKGEECWSGHDQEASEHCMHGVFI